MTKKNVDKIKKDYETVCEAYVKALCEMWQLDQFYGYWVGDEIGGMYCYGDYLCFNIYDLRYAVEKEVSQECYTEWLDYCSWASEFNQTIPNLKSWHEGCPRVSEEDMKMLSEKKKELERLCEESRNINSF